MYAYPLLPAGAPPPCAGAWPRLELGRRVAVRDPGREMLGGCGVLL